MFASDIRALESNLLSEGWSTDGLHRKRWRTLGALNEDLNRVKASWELMVFSLSTALARSSHQASHAVSSAAPQSKGAPNRVASSNSTRWITDTQGQTDFCACPDKFGQIWCHCLYSTAKVTSSRYPRFRLDFNKDRSGRIVLQISRGPIGSPCWASSSEETMYGPKNKHDGWLYADRQNT